MHEAGSSKLSVKLGGLQTFLYSFAQLRNTGIFSYHPLLNRIPLIYFGVRLLVAQ